MQCQDRLEDFPTLHVIRSAQEPVPVTHAGAGVIVPSSREVKRPAQGHTVRSQKTGTCTPPVSPPGPTLLVTMPPEAESCLSGCRAARVPRDGSVMVLAGEVETERSQSYAEGSDCQLKAHCSFHARSSVPSPTMRCHGAL